MDKELEENLKEEYPFLFKEENFIDDLKVFGFMCKDGWYNLLDVLFFKITKYLKEKPGILEDFFINEIKEKDGSLKVDMVGDKHIYNLATETKNISLTICEDCGRKGELQDVYGLYSTLCELCFKKAKSMNKEISCEEIEKRFKK